MLNKKLFYLFLISVLMIGLTQCDQNSINNNNPFLPNYNFSFDIDLNLPSYANLQFAGSSELITLAGAGVGGVIVFYNGSNYLAFDAACPNQVFTSCSVLELNGVFATCNCDDVVYNLFTGVPEGNLEGYYPLKPYRIEKNGSILRVFN